MPRLPGARMPAVEGVLDAFDGAAESGVVGVVLVGDEVHEGGMAAVGAQPPPAVTVQTYRSITRCLRTTVGRRLPKRRANGSRH
jgi:hypothetical protein